MTPADPLHDDSRWTAVGARSETPQAIVDELDALMRKSFGDTYTDIAQSLIPPPWGTLDTESPEYATILEKIKGERHE